jgi:hypothetical protein
MNILYYKAKLLGRPFRYGDGDGDGVGVGEAGAASPGAGGAPAGPGDVGIGDGSVADLGEIGIIASPIATSLAEAQANLGISPTEASMMSQSNATGSNVATNGMTQSELGLLSAIGLGDADISDTQTVDMALAAMDANTALTNNLPALLGLISPTLGLAVSQTQGLIGMLSGQTSIGQSIANAVIGQVAASLGVPVGVVAGIANGNPGQSVSAATTGAVVAGLASAISQATGIPASTISSGMSAMGVGQAIGSATSSAVNSATGVAPTGQSNTSSLAAAIDGALGVGSSSGSSATGSTTASTDSSTSAGGDNLDSLFGVNAGGLSQPAANASSANNDVLRYLAGNVLRAPDSEAESEDDKKNAADVQLMNDIFGTGLFATSAGDLNARNRELTRLLRS